MPHTYTVTDQVNFLESWFDSWSEFQKEDFLPVLVQALKHVEHVNGIVDGVKTLQVSGRRPSLFDCQVKLFHEWIDNWSEEEKNHFLSHIKISDPDFCEKLNQSLSQLQEKLDETASVDSTSQALSINEVENDKDNSVAPGSPTSSPLSSLSQPRSPQDSGLEESHFDHEANIQNLPPSQNELSVGAVDQQNVENFIVSEAPTQSSNIMLENSCSKPDPIVSQPLEEIV